MTLTLKEQKLLVMMLDLLSDRLADNGCNDLPDEWAKLFSERELKDFAQAYGEMNGDPEENHHPIADFCLASLLSEKIRLGISQ